MKELLEKVLNDSNSRSAYELQTTASNIAEEYLPWATSEEQGK